MKRFVLGLGFLSLIVGMYLLSNSFSAQSYPKARVTVGKVTIYAEVADTPDRQELGLGNRTNMDEKEGMLFIFSVPDTYGFWMKNMKFPIDIIWAIDGKVVSIQKSVSPDSFPQVFYPTEVSKYVLEVTSGFSDRHEIKVGDSFFVGS